DRTRGANLSPGPNPRQETDSCLRLLAILRHASLYSMLCRSAKPAPAAGRQHDDAHPRRRCRALCGSGALRHCRNGGNPMTDIVDIKAIRRALARNSVACLSAKHEAALLVWRAAATVDTDATKAADFLEMAAQRLRKGD